MKKVIKYLSTFMVMVAPLIIDWHYGPLVMIAGISGLCVEFNDNKQYHLILLNVTGIIAWTITFITR